MNEFYKRGFITAADGFGIYGVPRDLIYKWIERGKLASIKSNGKRLFLQRDLQQLIQQQKEKHNHGN